MCGIFCYLHFKTNATASIEEKINAKTNCLLQNRGPNLFGSHTIENENIILKFFGYVLWQQGPKPCPQPLILNENVLLFNGDIYMDEMGPNICRESDTNWLMNEFDRCKTELEFLQLFTQIKGPFSLIYYNATWKSLFVMRDSLGRQSLLLAIDDNHRTLSFSSIFGHRNDDDVCIEVPPIGIFKFTESDSITLFPWQKDIEMIHGFYTYELDAMTKIFNQQIQIGKSIEPIWLTQKSNNFHNDFSFKSLFDTNMKSHSALDIFETLLYDENVKQICDELLMHLSNSIEHRIRATPRLCKNCVEQQLQNEPSIECKHCKIGILFSGGIDCTILALLADRCINSDDPIDLLNVTFEKINRISKNNSMGNGINVEYSSPDRTSAKETLKELQTLCPQRQWNLVEINVSQLERNASLLHCCDLIYPLKTVLDDSLATALWFAASGMGHVNGQSYKSPCRVLLMGSGADELFAGYTRHRNAFQRNPTNAWDALEAELQFDWLRLPNRNLARDDRAIGDRGITVRAPFVCERVVAFVRSLRADQKCFYLTQDFGDKLLLRCCAFKMGLTNVCQLKKRALQFGSRIADSKQNAKDIISVYK